MDELIKNPGFLGAGIFETVKGVLPREKQDALPVKRAEESENERAPTKKGFSLPKRCVSHFIPSSPSSSFIDQASCF